ncbi:MAG: CPBP family intramembrane metalloprotease [candidate division KSB1 bacterium]|nr:CPBP family intramembrane metalloprotease [candidate division KSB1 bacterium]
MWTQNRDTAIDGVLSLEKSLAILFLTFVLILAAGIAGAVLGGRTEILLSEALVIVPAWIYVARSRLDGRTVFRLRRVPVQALWLSLGIGVAAALLGHELDVLVEQIFPMPLELQKQMEAMLRAKGIADGIILVVAIVGLAGVLEEMLFRGMLLASLEARVDVTRAVLFSALLFAFFHLNPWTAVQILLFGVILGVLAWRSQSVLPAALVHATNNAFEFAVLNLGEDRLRPLFVGKHVSPVLLLLAAVALYLGLRDFYRLFGKGAGDAKIA